LKHLAEYAGLPRGREKLILEQLVDAFAPWRSQAVQVEAPAAIVRHVESTLRMSWRETIVAANASAIRGKRPLRTPAANARCERLFAAGPRSPPSD